MNTSTKSTAQSTVSVQTETQETAKPTPRKSLSIKEKFQKKHGLYEDRNHFLILISTPLFDENNAAVWADLLPGLSDMGFQTVVRANASAQFKEIAEAFAEDHSALCSIISEEEYRDAYDVADVLLTFSNDEKTVSEVRYSLSKGVVPVLSHDFPLANLENYNPNLENGNVFMYYKQTPWSIFASLIRAYENYRFPYDWKNICKSAIASCQ